MTNTYKIDLFSDTNTNPTPGMRQAMCEAPVGNEVAGEDPTVNRLLERVCELLGKESAMFLPSGTMCNGIAYRVLCQRPGDTIILDESAHPVHNSAGLISGLAQAQPYFVKGSHGIFTLEQVSSIISAPMGYNLSKPRVVSIEQTTNLGGGTIWPLDTIEAITAFAHRHSVYTHMDGARLLHAVTETDIPASQYAKSFDSIWIDFSKGLGAPMGAVLAGSRSFIDEAWYYKFQQGGGMHQAGILAAGCLYGLEHHYSRIPEVHAVTKQLATLLSQIPFIKIHLETVQTNIILCEVQHPELTANHISRYLSEKGIRVLALDEKKIRMIVHLDITMSAVQEIFTCLTKLSPKVETQA